MDTILTSVQLAGARASDDAMKTVGEMVAHQEKAAEWAEAKAGPNYNAAAARFQGLSLGDGALTPDKSANSTESQDLLVWDNIPASQPDSYTSLRRKKLSRGILGTNPAARAGPSKRIRMQERLADALLHPIHEPFGDPAPWVEHLDAEIFEHGPIAKVARGKEVPDEGDLEERDPQQVLRHL